LGFFGAHRSRRVTGKEVPEENARICREVKRLRIEADLLKETVAF
jgi:hypothetical protein